MHKVASLIALVGATLVIAAPASAETRSDLVLGPGQTLSVTFDQPAGIVTCPTVPVVVTAGPVSLGGATLDVATSYPPGAGYGCVLIDNRSAGAISGTFAGLPEGTIFGPANARFKISYASGDGNDVALKRVEVPTTISGPTFETWYRERPSVVSIHVGGDTPTALAASGTVSVTVDGASRGTHTLQYGGATVDLGVLTIGTHQVEVAYSGGMHGGDLVFMPSTVAGTITITPAPVPNLPGAPATPPSTTPAPSAPEPTPPGGSPAPGDPASDAAPPAPTPSAIRAALREVDTAKLSRSRLTFAQTIPAAGTVLWQLLARTGGDARAMAEQTRTVTRAGTVQAELQLGAAGRRLLHSAQRVRLILRTTLVTPAGRKVVARTRVR